jgi:hypothetical protein
MSGIVKPLFNTPLNRDHWASQGLVASYLFNENSGRTVYDSSGNENHGTMVGFGAEDTPTSGWVPGPHGGALAFDGSNDCVRCGDGLSINNLASITLITWVDQAALGRNYIIGKHHYNWEMHLQSNTNKLAFLKSNAATYQELFVPISFSVNTLYQIVITFSQNKEANFYKNGILLSDSPLIYTTSGLGTSAYELQISGRPAGADYFNGKISSCFIYNRALSAEEITYLAAFPYCMYEQDEAIYSNTVPAKMNHLRRMVA